MVDIGATILKSSCDDGSSVLIDKIFDKDKKNYRYFISLRDSLGDEQSLEIPENVFAYLWEEIKK